MARRRVLFPLGVMFMLCLLMPLLSTSCKSPDNVAEGPVMTETEKAQMAQSGSVIVETVEDASRIAGFRVATPAYIPEGLTEGPFSVQQLGAGLPEEMRPKFVQINVERIWSLEGRRNIILVLTQSQHKFSVSGGEPAQICGRPGERWSDEAHDDIPARLGFSWEDGGNYFSLFGVLAGPLDEGTLEEIACSVRVE